MLEVEGEPTAVFITFFSHNFKRSFTGNIPPLCASTVLGSKVCSFGFGFGGPTQQMADYNTSATPVELLYILAYKPTIYG